MATAKASSSQRNLGYRHRQQVAALKHAHIEGTPCWWCGEPMYLAQGLHGDHSIARSVGGTVADRLLHGPCNAERGDGSKDDQRPALVGPKASQQAPPDLGDLALAWP